jgi:hypothetical protein
MTAPRVPLISAVRTFLTVWREGEADDELNEAVAQLAVAYEENRQYQTERRARARRAIKEQEVRGVQ